MMEQSTYYQNNKPFRHYISWHQVRISALAALAAVLIAIQAVAATNQLSTNPYRTHQHRHGGFKNINSLISNLTQSSRTVEDPPRLPSEDQRGCSSCTPDDLRREAIKLQILSKLGLKSRPKIRLPAARNIALETLARAGGNLLSNKEEKKEALIEEDEETLDGEVDDFYARTSEIITFAEPGPLLNERPLLEFSHSSARDETNLHFNSLKLKSALVWLRVSLNRSMQPTVRNLTLWIFKVRLPLVNASYLSNEEFNRHTDLVASLPLSVSQGGWHKIDVTKSVREWYEEYSRGGKLRLLVDCSGCKEEVNVLTFPGKLRHGRSLDAFSDTQRLPGQDEALDTNRPYLVVHMEPMTFKRIRRRALNCIPGEEAGHCCKESFFVSFKELKWDDWIIAPKGYHANYCRGKCSMHSTPDMYTNYHRHIMDQFRWMDGLPGFRPCCAPIKFSSMSLVFFGPDGNIIKRDLPRMVVEQCGCP